MMDVADWWANFATELGPMSCSNDLFLFAQLAPLVFAFSSWPLANDT
jgi:hypothetical protein